jgi:hypothetical protein
VSVLQNVFRLMSLDHWTCRSDYLRWRYTIVVQSACCRVARLLVVLQLRCNVSETVYCLRLRESK